MRRKWTGIPACLVLWDRLSFVCPLCVCGCAASGQAGMPVLFCRTDILVCPPCVCGCAASGQAGMPVLFCRTDILVCPLCVCGCAASGQALMPVLFCGTDFLLSVHFVFADAPQVDRHSCLSCFVGQTFFCLSTLCLRMRRKWTGRNACLVL